MDVFQDHKMLNSVCDLCCGLQNGLLILCVCVNFRGYMLKKESERSVQCH